MRFYKYQVLGNSFILIQYEDKGIFKENSPTAIQKILSIDEGLGADGLVLFDPIKSSIVFFNSDGSAAKFCGNGIRAYYVHLVKILKNFEKGFIKTYFGDDVYSGKVTKKINDYQYMVTVKVKNHQPVIEKITLNMENQLEIKGFLTTIGVDHLIIDEELNQSCFQMLLNNEELLSSVQTNPIFKHKPNIDLVRRKDNKNLIIKTYERGVGFTKSCGSGAISAAYVYHQLFSDQNHQETYKIITEYGKSKVTITKSNLILSSLVTLVASGDYYG